MLPPLLDVPEIQQRLLQIFSEGAPQRTYCTREIAARTVFVMLYIGAVEGTGMWTAPKHVYRMGVAQSNRRADQERETYIDLVRMRGSQPPPDRWFQDNTREPIRDETLRDGLVRMGAVVMRQGVPTTSSKGRYALQSAFASLFDPALRSEPLTAAIVSWQEQHLSPGALARVRSAAAFGVGGPIPRACTATKWRKPPNGSGTVFYYHESRHRSFRGKISHRSRGSLDLGKRQ